MDIRVSQGSSVGDVGSSHDAISISGPDAEALKTALSNMLSKNPLQSDASSGSTDGDSNSMSDEDILKMLLQRLEGESGDSGGTGGVSSTGSPSAASSAPSSSGLDSTPTADASSDGSGLSDEDLVKMLLQRLESESGDTSGSSDVSSTGSSPNTASATSNGLMSPDADYIDDSGSTGSSGSSGSTDNSTSGTSSSLMSNGLMDPNASYIDSGNDSTTTAAT